MNDKRQSSAKIFISSSVTSQWTNSASNTRIKVPVAPFILGNNSTAHFVIGVESLSVPIAMNMVGTSNQTLYIGGLPYTIPSGNYTATALTTALNTLTTGLYTWVYDSTANKFTITRTAGGNVVIGSLTTAYTILGISIGSSASPYTGEGLVNLTTTSGIIVRVLNIQNENRDNQGTGGSTSLARIPINCAPFRILQFYNSQPFYTAISNRTITELEIQLCDDNYNQLSLTGNPNWFLTLRVDYAESAGAQVLDKTKIQLARENIVPPDLKAK